MSFVNPNTCHLICNNFNLNFIFSTVCLCVCVCAFSLRRESPDMILGDKPLISEVVLSHPMSFMRYSGVSFNSATIIATKFVRPHKSHMRLYTTQCLLQQGKTNTVLNRHRQGLPSWSSKSDIRPLSSFLFSILHFSLIVPPGLTKSH
jgi:hypothetical protein